METCLALNRFQGFGVPAVRLLKIYGNRIPTNVFFSPFGASSSSFEDLWKLFSWESKYHLDFRGCFRAPRNPGSLAGDHLPPRRFVASLSSPIPAICIDFERPPRKPRLRGARNRCQRAGMAGSSIGKCQLCAWGRRRTQTSSRRTANPDEVL